MFMIGMIISFVVQIYVLIVILEVAMSWLIAFDIVNKNNEAAKNLTEQLSKVTGPAYKHLRKYVPPIGGIDLSPLILIFGVQLLGGLLASLFY